MRKNNSLAFKVAFGGIITALSIVLMFSTGIIPVLTYAVPALAGALLMMIVIEMNRTFAFSVYAAVGILSLFVVADKEAAVMYLVFFGYFPIIKSFLEKHLKKALCWIVKFLIFNASMVASYFIITKVFMLPFDESGIFGKYALLILLLSGNVVFVIYDLALTNLVSAYLFRWQKYLRRVFK